MNTTEMWETTNQSGCDNGSTFSRSAKDRILLFDGVTGLCSTACCLGAVLLVVSLRLYKHFVYRLATYQVLASMFLSFAEGLSLMLYKYNGDLLYYRVSCKMTAFLLEYGDWLKLFFTNWLTFHLFSYVVFFKNLKRLEWLYISSSVLGPLLFAWIPFIHNSFGLSGAWCFIRSWQDDCATKNYKEGIVEQFVLYYGPGIALLILNMIAIGVMFTVMLRRAWKSSAPVPKESQPLKISAASKTNQKHEVLKQLLPLLAYPIMYFALLFFPMVNRIYMAISSATNESLIIVQAVTQASKGFFAGLVLILHIAMVHLKRRKVKVRAVAAPCVSDHLSTKSEATPYTSGAITTFPLPNETDVENTYLNFHVNCTEGK